MALASYCKVNDRAIAGAGRRRPSTRPCERRMPTWPWQCGNPRSLHVRCSRPVGSCVGTRDDGIGDDVPAVAGTLWAVVAADAGIRSRRSA